MGFLPDVGKVLYTLLTRQSLDNGTIPAVCYDLCNNAFLEAQQTGETPELCQVGGEFITYYNGCVDCVNSTVTGSVEAARDYVSPQFSNYTEYCNTLQPNTSSTTSIAIPSSPGEPTTSTEQTLASTTSLAVTALPNPISTEVVPYSTIVDGVSTVWEFTKTIYPPVPETAVVSITTEVDDQQQVWSFTKTFSHLASDMGAALTTSSMTPTPTPSPSPLGPEIGQTQGLIVGAVVGPVAGVLFIVLLSWWLWRRRRNGNRTTRADDGTPGSEPDVVRKPELHGECLPGELEGRAKLVSNTPVELVGDDRYSSGRT